MKAMSKFVVGIMTSVALLACSQEDQQVNNQNQEEETDQAEESQADDAGEVNDTEEQVSDWAEVEIVEKELGHTFADIQLVNDQGGSRVIHYFEGDQPQYKSIYVKDDNRLKIVSMNEDEEGLIFNEIVDNLD